MNGIDTVVLVFILIAFSMFGVVAFIIIYRKATGENSLGSLENNDANNITKEEALGKASESTSLSDGLKSFNAQENSCINSKEETTKTQDETIKNEGEK